MPVRDKFPSEYFDSNPLEGEGPHGAYRRLQWGNEPNTTYELEAPEHMAVLGQLAKLVYVGGKKQTFREGEMFVAVGTRTNRVYLVPIVRGAPVDFARDFLARCEPLVRLKRIDYYSEKGGESGYYYHDHERPYPMLYTDGEHFVLEPAAHRGGRSYAVNDEGIIG